MDNPPLNQVNNMEGFEKLAKYFNSFNPEDPGYDQACYIRHKIAEMQQAQATIQNAEEELDDSEITSSASTEKPHQNIEGDIMGPAFQDLDALNQIDEQKKEIDVNPTSSLLERPSPKSSIESTVKHASYFEVLQQRLNRNGK